MNKRNNTKKTEITYIPQGDEQALNTKVEDLGLHPKTKELFIKNNILTVYDIAKRNSKQLFKIQGFGKKDLIGVERELAKLNVELAPLLDEESPVKEPQKKEPQVKEKKEVKDTEKQAPLKKEFNAEKFKGQKSVSIQDLALSVRTYNCLNRAKLLTTEDIINKSEKELLKVRNLSKQGFDEIVSRLNDLGLKLSEPVQQKEEKPQQVKQPNKKENKEPKKVDNEYRRISKGEKFGIGKGKEVIIPPMYDEVFMVKEDMVCVDVDGLFGYVNLNNEMVVEPKYELAQSFSRGLANVMLNDLYGYIDKEGNVVLDFKYELATPFEDDDTARVKLDGRWASINKKGEITWI